MITITSNDTTYRSLLAIAARYSDRLPLSTRIEHAIDDFDDTPEGITASNRTALLNDTLTFFHSI